ncbi:MAG: hypothetical protein CMI02_02020 [Oceanospirillaceae bacterium]|nr:hypothetical protein [Oceanospirillaceae bacterium]MBT10797.1 hypothetical protein [Oceanospirillaceae bacterium]|tara:strand:- start:176 stop:520 length:345 start_codon:yes stop_codon:yes gene_type:complete
MTEKMHKEEFDALLSRIFIFLVGGISLALATSILYHQSRLYMHDTYSEIGVGIGIILAAIGFPVTLISIFGSKKKTTAWTSNVWNYKLLRELLFLFFILALGFTYILKKLGRKI